MSLMNPRKAKVADYRGCVVLIYCSDRSFLDYYRAMFISLGLSPVTATTPEVAMGVLRLAVVGFVVMDEAGGLSECRMVMRRAGELQHQGTLVVIGRDPDQIFRHEAIALGAAEYLDHPALPEDIIRALLPSHPSAHAQRTAPRGH